VRISGLQPTSAERDLFQAPIRAGIRVILNQLLPLRLRLPRVNLLIADAVGLGKIVEAGLIMRVLLLRRPIDFIQVRDRNKEPKHATVELRM
jgi:hypothetical protein